MPLALADLARRWRCGNGSPFWSSTAVTGTSSSAPSSSPFSPPLAFWVCAAEVLPGGLSKRGDGESEMTTAAEATTRDLLRSSFPSRHPGGDGRGRKPAQSPRSPSRWASSARDLLTGLTSPSPSPPRPLRFSVGSDGGGFGGRNSLGGGRAGKGAVAAADGVLLASRVLAGVTEFRAEGVEAALALFRRVRKAGRLGRFEGASRAWYRFSSWLALRSVLRGTHLTSWSPSFGFQTRSPHISP